MSMVNINYEGARINVAAEIHAAGVNGGYIVTAHVPITGAQGHFRDIRVAGPYLTRAEAETRLAQMAPRGVLHGMTPAEVAAQAESFRRAMPSE